MSKMEIRIELTQDARDHLNMLKQATEIYSDRQLLNAALTMLDWAVKQRLKGRTIASIDEDDQLVAKLRLPGLDTSSGHFEE